MAESGSAAREALRQQMLLRTLWRHAPDSGLSSWLRQDGLGAALGLAAYRGNGLALAERALTAAYPTVAELVGEDCFGALARRCWQRHPPQSGDVAQFGEGLAALIEADEQLAAEPYLADVARLEAMHRRCESAADVDGPIQGLELLAGEDSTGLQLSLRPGTQWLASRWPVVSIWQAHRRGGADRFAAVRQAFAEQRAESALVFRDGWRVRVVTIAAVDLHFTQALHDGVPLGAALQAAGPAFSFETWLVQAMQQGWLIEVRSGLSPQAPVGIE